MKHLHTTKVRKKFSLLTATRLGQAAIMILQPGTASEEEPKNEHQRSEQWLYVISGTGVATIGRTRSNLRRVKLRQGSLLIIERGELHQIRNAGHRALRTLNVYLPPAYHTEGEPLSTAHQGE